tara:strand:- start:1340 stop:1765 length:426 start_codon:yes stop_codon:yes gene_type:complete
MFKKLFSKNKEEPKEEKTRKDKDPKVFLLYSVDEDGIIDLDFKFDIDSMQSNELFSEMFYQLNNGQLLETSLTFIYKTLKHIDSDVAKEFDENIEVLNKISNNFIINSVARTPEVNPSHLNDDVVVKPSDIAKSVLGGEKL